MTFIYSLKSLHIVLQTLFYLIKAMTWKAYMTFAPLLLLGVKYAGMSMFILSIRKNLS